jgi:hypothetical protein
MSNNLRYAVFRRKFFIFSLSQNPFVVKLPQLLSQFLYQTKKLDLPGIGSFTLDPNVVIPGDADKDMQTIASGISFKNTIIREPDDALVSFIKEHTGKMKPLAASDLDFFLTSGKQLMNIGKPFYLEGIGVLMQNKEGKLDFTPGEYSRAKLEDHEAEKRERGGGPGRFGGSGSKTVIEESNPAHRSHHEQEPKSNTMRQVVLLTVIIAGLVIIGWGGYTLYKKNTVPEPAADRSPVADTTTAVIPPPDTTKVKDTAKMAVSTSGAGAGNPAAGTTAVKKPDIPPSSPKSNPPVTAFTAPSGPGTNPYKFIILETTHKGHALRRYNQLLGFQLNIKMEQKDSAYFKLYFPIAATIRDTTHIKDSLADVYAAQVRIER